MGHQDFLEAFAVSQGLESVAELSAPKYKYVTASRDAARPIVETLLSRLPAGLKGTKVLHIGAGYGGLAIELAKHGASVVGVETADPKRSLAEIHAQGEAEVKFVKSYLTVRSHVDLLRQEEGLFNIVIVHELFRRTYDTLTLLNHLKSLMAPDALIVYRVTNFFTPQAVMRDPVHKTLGLTLLPPDRASEYAGGSYPLYFRTKDYYDALFNYVGFLNPQMLGENSDASYDATRKIINTEAQRIRKGLREENFSNPKMFPVVRTVCREYLDELAADVRAMGWDELFQKYRAPHWECIRQL